MWEQRVHTDFVLRFQEHEFGLAVFERDGIVGLDFNAPERFAIPGDSVAYGNIISRVQQRAACAYDGQRGFHARKLYDAWKSCLPF